MLSTGVAIVNPVKQFSIVKASHKRLLHSPYTWNDYLVSYLDKRRVERLTRLSRYYPTKVDAASIILLYAKFVHSEVKRKRSRK